MKRTIITLTFIFGAFLCQGQNERLDEKAPIIYRIDTSRLHNSSWDLGFYLDSSEWTIGRIGNDYFELKDSSSVQQVIIMDYSKLISTLGINGRGNKRKGIAKSTFDEVEEFIVKAKDSGLIQEVLYLDRTKEIISVKREVKTYGDSLSVKQTMLSYIFFSDKDIVIQVLGIYENSLPYFEVFSSNFLEQVKMSPSS